ncbi:hypothetical protein [Nocardia paucivorans]|uniref:hypothetical protein n=1 Tax=Nocardia paucivorans TaxID=114259 RepID=UPI000308FFB0|nr:hypothetical protein [Nocardia paucivorans]
MAPLEPKKDRGDITGTGGVMKPGEELKEGQWLWSKNNVYRMGLEDGRMVIVHNDTGKVVHTSGDQTNGVRIKFTEEYGLFHAGRHRLELLSKMDNEDSDLWVAQPDTDGKNNSGYKGPGADENTDWDDEDNHKPDRFILTDDGNIVAYKGNLPDGFDGKLDVKKDKGVLWYWRDPKDIHSSTIDIQKKQYIDGDRPGKSPEAGSKISDFPLKIKEPPGASDDLKLAIGVANLQLKYLMSQMGSGDYILPEFLKTDEKKDKKAYEGTIWRGSMDDNLTEDFAKAMGEGAMGKGDTSEAYQKAVSTLEQQEVLWDFSDENLAGLTEKLGHANHRVYKRMYDEIEELHKKIWKATEAGVKDPDNPDKMLYTEGGIQNRAEEVEIFKFIRDSVVYCIKQVNEYADLARESGIELKDKDPKGPGYKEPTKEEPEKKPTEKGPQKGPTKKETNNNTPPGNTNIPPGNTNIPPGNANIPPGNTNIPPGTVITPNDGQPTDNTTTNPTDNGLQDGKTDPSKGTDGTDSDPSSTDSPSQVGPSPTQPGPVTAPPVQPVNTGGGMDSTAMAAVMPAMLAMAAAQLGNQMKSSESDRDHDDKDDKQKEKTGPTSPAPGATAPAPGPGDPNAAPPGQVTAPTDTGTPPPITAPGQMVQHQLPDKSTVQVPPTVAEALNKVQANTALDAVSAYQGTVGESTPEHPWMTVASANDPIDGGRLSTGDVVQWDDGQNRHSALLVKKDGGLFFLDNGQLVPFDTESPNSDKYGKFAGVFHPSGIDAGSSSAPEPTELPPPVVTQQQPASPPPVAPPAQV